MFIIKSLILGIIQGLSEFLPISSSGHLVLAEHLLNFNKPGISFEIFLHLGSLLAVFIYFRKDIGNLIISCFNYKKEEYKDNRKVIFYLLISTVVTAVIGISFKDFFEKIFDKPRIVSLFLFITGLILLLSDRIDEKNSKKASEMGWCKAVIIGLGQAFAIIPGISRSGSTVATSVILKVNRKDSARFSFLLSIPVILGAVLLELDALFALDKSYYLSYIVGFLGAFLSGFAVISWMLDLINKRKLRYFSYYCFFIALVSFILLSIF